MKHSITDKEILELILIGVIKAKYIGTRDPIIVHKGLELTPGIVPGKQNPRYRVEICRPRVKHKRRKRSIMRSKLVWMIWHKKVVPAGHQIHHRDEDRFNDSWQNLECTDHDTHNGYHYEDF